MLFDVFDEVLVAIFLENDFFASRKPLWEICFGILEQFQYLEEFFISS
jgi:hypothetical protein